MVSLAACGETQSVNEPSLVRAEGSSLRDNVFIGEGRMVSFSGEHMGGQDFQWYFHPFVGLEYLNIFALYIDIVGQDEFEAWTRQFPSGTNPDGQRSRGEANVRTFIDDFELTLEDLIGAWEALLGKSMEEAESIILWAREAFEHGDFYAIDESGNKAMDWDFMPTISEIALLFSDDVYELWEAFPGFGVIQDGRVYSPE